MLDNGTMETKCVFLEVQESKTLVYASMEFRLFAKYIVINKNYEVIIAIYPVDETSFSYNKCIMFILNYFYHFHMFMKFHFENW